MLLTKIAHNVDINQWVPFFFETWKSESISTDKIIAQAVNRCKGRASEWLLKSSKVTRSRINSAVNKYCKTKAYLIFYLPRLPTGCHLNRNFAWIQNYSSLSGQNSFIQLTYIESLKCKWTRWAWAEVDSCQKFWGISLFLGKCRVTLKDFHVLEVKIKDYCT